MPFNQRHEARTAKAVLTIGEKTVPVSSVNIHHTIDQLPYAEIFVQLDNKDSRSSLNFSNVNIDITTFRDLAKVFQEYVYNSFRLKPNARLQVEDGNGRVLTFNGFIGAPKVMIMNGVVTIVLGMVHAKTALQAFNAQIYTHNEKYLYPFLTEAFEPTPNTNPLDPAGFNALSPGWPSEAARKLQTNTQSVSLRLLAIIESMVQHPYIDTNQVRPTEFDFLPIHLMNTKSLDLVREVLNASERTTIVPGLGSADFSEVNIRQSLWQSQVNGPNFLASLPDYCTKFLFQMNSDWAGNLWLERLQTLEDPKDRVISVPISEIRFDAAHLFEIPVIQVIVGGADLLLYLYSGAMGSEQGAAPQQPVTVSGGAKIATEHMVTQGESWAKMQCYAKFPAQVKRNAAGNFFVMTAPDWLSPDALLDGYAAQIASEADPNVDRFTQLPDVDKNTRNKLVKNNKPRELALQYLARQYFQSLYLGATFASIAVPFDVRPCVGRTYTVQDLDGKPIFMGFLREITHNVVVTADTGSSAMTTLSFSHIRMAGAELDQLLGTVVDAGPVKVQGLFDPTYVDPAGAVTILNDVVIDPKIANLA